MLVGGGGFRGHYGRYDFQLDAAVVDTFAVICVLHLKECISAFRGSST